MVEKGIKFFNHINKTYMLEGKYTVGKIEPKDTWDVDEAYYVFKYGIPIIRCEDKRMAHTIVYYLNIEVETVNLRTRIIQEMQAHDNFRKQQQRTLEAKIRRLKDRVKVFEKNCSAKELRVINENKRWKKQ